MPLFYSTNAQGLTTNATTATETDQLRTLTGTTRPANFIEVIGTARSNTVGGWTLRLRKFSTPSTVGSAITPTPDDPGNQAATITATTGPTAGSTATQIASFGGSQVGAQIYWCAQELAQTPFTLNANGGANGNLDVFSIANGTSVPFDLGVKHFE